MSQQNFLAPWEVATGVAEASLPGLTPARWGGRLTWAFGLLFSIILWPEWGGAGVIIALLFGRLMALDLTTYTLPHIYTVPLLVSGLIAAMGSHFMLAVFFGFACWVGYKVSVHWQRGLAGGDWLLLAALFAWHGPPDFFGILAIISLCGVFFILPSAWRAATPQLPFGLPILLGWVVVLAFPNLPYWLFSPISG